MKPIKFDLKLSDGTPLRVLSDIEQNLTPELLEYFQTGKLTKWLKVRNLEEHAQKMEALLILEKEHQAQLFKEFCAIFGRDLNEDEVREVMQNYKKLNAKFENSDDEFEQLNSAFENSNNEIEWLKTENEMLKTENEGLGQEVEKHKSEISELQLKIERQQSQILWLERNLSKALRESS